MVDDPDDDDAIVIDLTHPYELDWMARGRKEQEYKQAFRDRLQDEYGLEPEEADRFEFGRLAGSVYVSINERDWDVIWQRDAPPGEAMEQYLGEAWVERTALELQDELSETERKRYQELEQQADREEAKRSASERLERYLLREGFEDYAISGIGPWHDTSPYEVDEDDWDAVLDSDVPSVLGHEETPVLVEELGEDDVLETAAAYVDGVDTDATR